MLDAIALLTLDHRYLQEMQRLTAQVCILGNYIGRVHLEQGYINATNNGWGVRYV